jgi:hypothetical protein
LTLVASSTVLPVVRPALASFVGPLAVIGSALRSLLCISSGGYLLGVATVLWRGALFSDPTVVNGLDSVLPLVWCGTGGLGRSDQLGLYWVVEHVCLLALVAGFARRSLQLVQCVGDISGVAAVLGAAVAIVLPCLILRSVSSRTALGGANGVDQLAFAHSASALDSKGACQLLQLGEDHGVQA